LSGLPSIRAWARRKRAGSTLGPFHGGAVAECGKQVVAAIHQPSDSRYASGHHEFAESDATVDFTKDFHACNQGAIGISPMNFTHQFVQRPAGRGGIKGLRRNIGQSQTAIPIPFANKVNLASAEWTVLVIKDFENLGRFIHQN